MNGMNGIKECGGSIEEIESRVIGAAYEVSNVLGAGFLEKVYHRAMRKELALRGLAAESEVAFRVEYKGESIGNYMADLLVEKCLIVEIKCVDHFTDQHVAQCLNYLAAGGFRQMLLINFQKSRVDWRRIVRGRVSSGEVA
jgi:GxxExxY protein